MLKLIQKCGGRIRIDWAIGVGKSYCLDQTIESSVKSDLYDLIVALFPTRQIIDERQWILKPPGNVRIVNLKPRTRSKCGTTNDRLWKHFEKKGLGVLGRIELCGHCLLKGNCHWPRQFGKQLEGVHVIFGTQAHLERAPSFIDQLMMWTGAERVLVLLDEINFITKSFHRRICKDDLELFVEVLKCLKRGRHNSIREQWLYKTDLLLSAATEDLRCSEWYMPTIYPDWSLAVQSRGYKVFGDHFKFLGFDLRHFGMSPIESREKDPKGDVIFAATPVIKGDFVIFSGTAHQEFSQFRFGKEFASPFEQYRFEHPGTRWYNIASRTGMKMYFPKNSKQILDFFAGLVVKRVHEGKRVLLIAKKCFIPLCAKEMEVRLRNAGLPQTHIISNGWTSSSLNNPHIIPIIHYGLIGTNLFQHFDCAYCLCGFYVAEQTVNDILQDVLASDMNIPIKVYSTGHPCRRRAGVLHAQHRGFDVHRLAQLALDHQEMDSVLQAVGRVRPYTKPREIITFQCAEHPKLSYTREFNSIKEARQFFEVDSQRNRQKQEIISRVLRAKEAGLKQTEVARKLGCSLITVKRYWNYS
jgi:hypothetical protein